MNIDGALPPLSVTLNTSPSASTASNNKQSPELSEQDQQLIEKLKARDQVVRSHEAAHLAAGAGIVHGGASFSFQRGPNGVQYAIGGEVGIDTSKIAGNPEATLRKAEQIRAAALAPAQPSSQDRNIAAQAVQMAIEARAEIARQQSSDNATGQRYNPFLTSTTSKEPAGNLFDSTA